ncbi:MAG: hypothetical protein J5769_04620 [Bacteroidales bacterium]|nr:hypothetical protein [Bacteroidales bacterium]
MKRILFAAALAALVLLPSCKNRRQQANLPQEDSTAVEEPVVIPLQEDKALDDAARILAGMEVAPDSPLAPWMEKSFWKKHREEMDRMWATCRETLDKIDTFAVTDLKDINEKALSVFYPFSGPDFPYAAAFFPKPTTYWFMALEKTGSIPVMDRMSEHTFSMYRNAMRTHLKSSYFITNAMDNDLANNVIDGTIPIMMVLMARMDFHIASITYQVLADDGSLTPSDKPTDVVEIKYFNREENVMRTVYYLYANLRDEYFKAGTQALIDTFDPATTAGYTKSCSYCMHKPHFSQVRNDMLQHAFAVVQDDTGVPYKYFEPEQWDVTLYGGYTHPLASFEAYTYQLDLVQAYKGDDIKPLAFKHGYMKISSLIVARKK